MVASQHGYFVNFKQGKIDHCFVNFKQVKINSYFVNFEQVKIDGYFAGYKLRLVVTLLILNKPRLISSYDNSGNNDNNKIK